MPDFTIVVPFYLNSSMLARQYENWASWGARIIVVDDGSPEAAADVPRPPGLNVEIYRVKEDRPWHQHAARNLGAHAAPDGWLLLTDMDHMLTAGNAERLLERELDPGTVYMMDRVEVDTGKPTTNRLGQPKPHPNSFVMTREMYWKIGGYDEDYCGIYGTDALFRDRVFRTAKRGHLDIPLVRYWRDIIPDASTTTLPRKEGRDPGARDRVLAAKRARGEQDLVKVLQFAWEKVV